MRKTYTLKPFVVLTNKRTGYKQLVKCSNITSAICVPDDNAPTESITIVQIQQQGSGVPVLETPEEIYDMICIENIYADGEKFTND